MSFSENLTRSNFIIKLKSWEYWPFGIVHFPLFLYFLWLSIRARSLLFFSASNPGIAMGGMFGESKYEVLTKIPTHYVPRTTLITIPSTREQIMCAIHEAGLKFPVIFKPDLGERGFMVRKISHLDEIDNYISKVRCDFLVQEFIDMPLEFGIFYTRFPSEEKGKVTSIVVKEMLTVSGDGRSSFRELVLRLDRAKLQWDTLKIIHRDRLDQVPLAGEKIELVSIGNHCLGTKFLDGTHLITPELSNAFDAISKQIPGFYFGRYDLRCNDLTDLNSGNIKIMELNGCGAEPAHIYQPGFSLMKALGVLFKHWQNIFVIARENEKHGIRYTAFKEALVYYKKFKAATTLS